MVVGATPGDHQRVRVLIVDDHLAFAEAIAVVLDAEPDIEVTDRVTSAAAAELAARRSDPDVVLLDVDLGASDGLDAISRLREVSGRLQVLVVSCSDDVGTVCAAVRAGSSGFVTKDCPPSELVAAVRSVHRGESSIPPRLLTGVLQSLQAAPGQATPEEQRLARLSRREREVLSLMVGGLDRAAIARELYLSANTVRTHAQNVLGKLELHSSLEAVSLALRAGMRPARRREAGRPA